MHTSIPRSLLLLVGWFGAVTSSPRLALAAPAAPSAPIQQTDSAASGTVTVAASRLDAPRVDTSAASVPRPDPAQHNDRELPPATLDQVLAFARQRAPEVLVAQAELTASRASGVGARLAPVLNPYIEVIAERGGRGVTRDVYITAQAHTPFEIAGQRSRRIAETDAFVELHRAGVEQVRAEVSAAAVRRYGECLAWEARYQTLAELLKSAATESEVLAARRDAGDATERDAQLAEVERARIAVQLEETRASLTASLNELARLTGKRFGAPDATHPFPHHYLTKSVVFEPTLQVATANAARSPVVRIAEAEANYFTRVNDRASRDGIPPVTMILQAGRGDFAETRLGVGVAWSLPVFRRNQGERAVSQAEASRARVTATARRHSIAQQLSAIAQQEAQLYAALEKLDKEAIPAATLATDSATRMHRAGKTDLLSVVVARRDLFVLRLRRMELAERFWGLLGDWVELTGSLPRQPR
jgi:cobalt-zinc-cadmium efflux system outer membrane protein